MTVLPWPGDSAWVAPRASATSTARPAASQPFSPSRAVALAESQVPSAAVGPVSVLPGSTPAGPPVVTTSVARVTSRGDCSRSLGYDVSRLLVLSDATSELVRVIRLPTAVTSRHPTAPGAVESWKVISPGATSMSATYSHVMRVIGRLPSPSPSDAFELWRARSTRLPPAVSSSPRAVVAHSRSARVGRSSIRSPSCAVGISARSTTWSTRRPSGETRIPV